MKSVRDEHKQAIDWLNEHTDQKINIFAIQMEVWQIGDSSCAPKFNIIAQPNDWAKAVKNSTSAPSELSATKMLQLEFWTKLKEYVQYNKFQIKLRKARPQHWYDISMGSSNAHICLTINSQTNQLGSEIYIANSKDLYDGLEAKKNEIESELSEKLEWKPLPKGKASRIKLSRSGELNNQDSWEDYHQWLCEKVQEFQNVFGKEIKNINNVL